MGLLIGMGPWCMQARVIEAGGSIVWQNGYRVMGALSMTRAIGDHVLQKFGISPKPEVRVLRLYRMTAVLQMVSFQSCATFSALATQL